MSSEDHERELQRYRDEIDKTDADMLDALGERMKVVRKIAELKKSGEMDIEDRRRDKEVSDNWRRLANSKGLSGNFVQKILDVVLDYSKQIEKR